MGLLVENLQAIDAEGMPAYLESSNPANCPRYEEIGFERIGSFSTPDGSHEVAMMWRATSGTTPSTRSAKPRSRASSESARP